MRARADLPLHVTVLLALLASAAPADALAGTGPDERVILVFDGPLTSLERAELALSGVTLEREFSVTHAAVARVPAVAAHSVAASAFVARAQPVEPLEYHLAASKSLVRAEAADVRDLGVTGRGVTVAVVDSGVDVTHPDLDGRVVANVRLVDGRFVDSPVDGTGHGTHVAGIVAGSGRAGGPALVGVAPDARILGVDISGEFDTAAALEAFDWLFLNRDRFGVDVVVAAWGRQSRGERFDPNDALVKATNRLVRDGVVVVFSASNHGPSARTLSLEAQNPDVITVGATDDAGVLASYSSRGPALDASGAVADWVKPDLVAPGTRVLAARAATGGREPTSALTLLDDGLPGDAAAATAAARYTELTGTSQSAPHVAGVVALMLEANPRLTPAGVMNALRRTAIDLGPAGPDPGYGFGLVDARDAVLAATEREPDRGNVLLAGGTETFEARGRFVGADGRGLQTEPVVRVADDGEAAFTFPLKPGARRVAVEFAWTPPAAGAFRVYLTASGVTEGPWSAWETEDGRRVIRATVDARDLPPGEWTVLALGAAAGDVSYVARASVDVEARPDSPRVLDPRHVVPEKGTTERDSFIDDFRHTLDLYSVRWQVAERRLREWASENPLTALAMLLAATGFVTLAVGWPILRRQRERDGRGP